MTAAQRQRRSRAHKRGDHSLCDPTRCPDVTQPVTAVTPADVTPDVTATLGPRGAHLWRELHPEGAEHAAEREALALELCRIVDRLDRLNALLTGEVHTWAELTPTKGDDDRYELVIDRALAEARQHATTLPRLLAGLRMYDGAAAPVPGARRHTGVAQPAVKVKGGAIVDLAARIAAARGQTTTG